MSVRLCTLLSLLLCTVAHAVDRPDYLSGQAAQAFDEWREAEPHRAFAVADNGAWGQSWRHQTIEAARSAALGYCREHADNCMIVAVDDRLMVSEWPFGQREKAGTEPTWPQGVSVSTARWLALAGFWLLLVGSFAAWRWPWMGPARRQLFSRRRILINYTWVFVVTGYVLCQMPLLAHWLPTRAGPWWHWLAWIAIIGVLPVSALLLHRAGKLSRTA